MAKMFRISAVCLLFLGLSSVVFGAVYWDNDSGDQKWETLTNWSGDAGPTANPAVNVSTPNSVDECIIGSGVLANEPSTLWIGNNVGTEGSVVIDGGDLVCSQFVRIGYNGKGTLRLKSGLITTGLYDVEVGGSQATADGTLIMEGGTISVARSFCLGEEPGSVSTVNMTGGSIRTTLDFGRSGGSTYQKGVSTINMSSGTIHPLRDFYAGYNGGSFTMNMSGGLIDVGGVFKIADGDSSTALFTLSGGVIETTDFTLNESAVSANLDIRGGTLIIDGDKSSEINGFIGGGLITAWGGYGEVLVSYNTPNAGRTTVTSAYFDPNAAYDLAPVGREPDLGANLSWQAGLYADLHRVYFSTNFDDVNERQAAADKGYQVSGYDVVAGDLLAGQRYYWCVDEYNSVSMECWPGEVVSFMTPTGSIENAVYRVDLYPDLTMNTTNKGSGVSADFLPEFTVIYSYTKPSLYTATRHQAVWSEDENPFHTGTNYVVDANLIEVIDGNFIMTFPEQSNFTLSASLGLSDDYNEPMLSYNLTAKTNGWFMTAYTGAPEANPATMEIIPQPATWGAMPGPPDAQPPLFPDEPKLIQEIHTTLPAVLTRDNGLSCAVVVHPDYQPFRQVHYKNMEFGVCIRNQAGNAQPIIFAPEMGAQFDYLPVDKDSYLAVGQSHDFGLLWIVDSAEWREVYRGICEDIYSLRDQRDNSGPGSMNNLLANLADYALDADGNNYNMWDPQQKCNEYFTDQPFAFKILGGIFAINAAVVLDNNDMFWSRSLPQVEYCLSRETQGFAPYDYDYLDALSFTHNMNGPFICGIDLGNLYRISGGRTTAFKTYSQEKSFVKIKALFDQSLEWYRLWGDSSDLDFAIEGANYVLDNPYHLYDFQKFLEIYEETGDVNFLNEAQDYAYTFTTTLHKSPEVPDINIIVDENNEAPIHWGSPGRHIAWGFDPPLPMYAPEQDVPAWRPALIGMQPESYRAFTNTEFPGSLIRLANYTNNDFLRTLARWSFVGRWANYPGQQTSVDHSLVWEQDNFCMHPLEYMTFTSMHFWHHWEHFVFVVDFLVNEAISKSEGNIDFPRHRLYNGGSGGRQNFWGHEEGVFYGDEHVRLWIPRDLLNISTEQINYIAGYGNGKLYLALSNQSDEALSGVSVTLNPALVGYGSLEKAKVWQENICQGYSRVSDGTVTIDIAAKGFTVLAVEGVDVKTSRVHKELFGDKYSLSTSSLSRTTEPFGKMVGMVISFGSELSEAYCYTDAKAYFFDDGDTNYVTMYYSVDGGAWQETTDEIFPFEFSIPLTLDANSDNFSFYLKVYDRNNVSQQSATRTLSLVTTAANPGISGRVIDVNGIGIGDVFIQSSDGKSAYTNTNGYYTIEDVSDGSKTMTTSKSGYEFIPSSRTVTVSGSSIENVDWMGKAGTLESFDYLTAIASHWLDNNGAGCAVTPVGDLNEDCEVNFMDFALIP